MASIATRAGLSRSVGETDAAYGHMMATGVLDPPSLEPSWLLYDERVLFFSVSADVILPLPPLMLAPLTVVGAASSPSTPSAVSAANSTPPGIT
jgi:hypothetical protein